MTVKQTAWKLGHEAGFQDGKRAAEAIALAAQKNKPADPAVEARLRLANSLAQMVEATARAVVAFSSEGRG